MSSDFLLKNYEEEIGWRKIGGKLGLPFVLRMKRHCEIP